MERQRKTSIPFKNPISLVPNECVYTVSGDPAFSADILFYKCPLPVWVFDRETLAFLYVNDTAQKHYGYTEEQFRKMTIADIRPESARSGLLVGLSASTTARTHRKVVHKNAEGTILLVDVHVQPVCCDGKGAMLAMVENITKSVSDALQIEQLEKELRQVQAAISDAAIVSVTNVKGCLTYVNKNFETISGYSALEILGRPHSYISSGEHDKKFWKQLWAHISKGNIWRGDIKNKAKDGSVFWTDTHIVPMKNEEGAVRCYYCIRTLNTDQKKMEEQIREEKNKLEAFFNSAAEACVLLSPSYEVLAFNKRAKSVVEKLYGVEMKAHGEFSQYCSKELKILVRDAMPRVLRGEELLNIEMEKTYANGEQITWNLKFLPARDVTGVVIGMAFSVEDITAFKLFEATIIDQNNKLRDVAWKNSHLLRAPLCNIISLLQLMNYEPADAKVLLAYMEHEAEVLDKVIRDISHTVAEVLPQHPSARSIKIPSDETN